MEAGGWRRAGGGERVEAGGRRRVGGGERVEAGGWRRAGGGGWAEAGGRRRAGGGGRAEAGGWRRAITAPPSLDAAGWCLAWTEGWVLGELPVAEWPTGGQIGTGVPVSGNRVGGSAAAGRRRAVRLAAVPHRSGPPDSPMGSEGDARPDLLQVDAGLKAGGAISASSLLTPAPQSPPAPLVRRSHRSARRNVIALAAGGWGRAGPRKQGAGSWRAGGRAGGQSTVGAAGCAWGEGDAVAPSCCGVTARPSCFIARGDCSCGSAMGRP